MPDPIYIDFDATIAHYDKWEGLEELGEPIEGSKKFLEECSKIAPVIIYSTRTSGLNRSEKAPKGMTITDYAKSLIKTWLDKHGYIYQDIYTGQGKPPALAYVDDKAVTCRPQEEMDPEKAYAAALVQIKKLVKK
jgi:hypothetical protein